MRFTHLAFDAAAHEGEMVVAASVADTVLDVFRRLSAAGRYSGAFSGAGALAGTGALAGAALA
ncbi:MAG: hypothetical protein HY906_07440, partial [Deltaproteobacteria bacterium]|nr:hypothetical protein [Deltaproteobacteria bacterium]